MENEKQLSVSEKNAALREELWKQGLNVYSVGQLGRIDFLVVTHFEPDPNAPHPLVVPLTEEEKRLYEAQFTEGKSN